MKHKTVNYAFISKPTILKHTNISPLPHGGIVASIVGRLLMPARSPAKPAETAIRSSKQSFVPAVALPRSG